MYPIRVLHVVGIMNMGGLENLIMNIYRNIDRNKIQFDFLVTREENGIFDEEIKSLGGKIYNIPHMSKVGYRKYASILYDFFKKHSEYKIAHCHRDALCSIYLNQARKANIPIRIAHSHNIRLSETKDIKGMITTLIKKICMPFTVKNATNYFACSKDAGEWLFGKEVANEKLRIINNGIDTKKYIYDENISKKIRSELNIAKETLLIGHVGRFDIQKNHNFLIDIVNKLKSEVTDFKLCLVGEGCLKVEIEEKIKKLNLHDNVIFLDIRNDINELMMAFDIFIFPSLFEGLGIVLIEAQATGLKSLTSDQVPKEADMNVGLLDFLSLDDIDSWVDKIKLSSKNKQRLREDRCSDQKSIINNGYDIFTTTSYIQDFYIDSFNKCKMGSR